MSDERLHHLERRVRRSLDEAAADGTFDGLPRPSDPRATQPAAHVPDHLRQAHKILADAGMAPAWIELGREIRRELGDLRARSVAHRRRVRAERAALTAGRASEFAARLNRLSRLHATARLDFAERVARGWRRIEAYNVTAPAGAPHFTFWPAAEGEKFDDAWPWAKPTEPDPAS